MQRDNFQNALQDRILCELSQWTSEWDWRGAKVLDIGSRYGHRTEQLAQRLAPLKIDAIRGVDIDVHGVEFATKNLADEKLEFSFIADLEDRLPLKYSQAFDWVLHINPTLFHLNNQEAALRNLLFCLKPSSGRLLLAIPCQLPTDLAAATSKIILKKMGKQLNQWMAEALDVNKKTWYGHPNADRIYAHLMERVGFCIHRTKIMDFKYKFEQKNEHRASVEAYFFDAIMSFPEEQRDALARRLYSCTSGSGLRRSLRWEARYVLVLASRMAITCEICYSVRNLERGEELQDANEDDEVPPPLPLVGPPPDVEGEAHEISVAVVHNEDFGDVDESDHDNARLANDDDDENVSNDIRADLFTDDINQYDRATNDDDEYVIDAADVEVDYKERGNGNAEQYEGGDVQVERTENIYDLDEATETATEALNDLNKLTSSNEAADGQQSAVEGLTEKITENTSYLVAEQSSIEADITRDDILDETILPIASMTEGKRLAKDEPPKLSNETSKKNTRRRRPMV